MSNFFVPIEYSDVKEVIPVGEDIIYSTLFMVNTYNVEMGVGPMHGSRTQNYSSHALFTENGVAYQAYKGGALVSKYIPWYKIDQINVANMGFKKGKMGTMFNFVMQNDPNYEAPEIFTMRIWRFYFEYTEHVINQKKAHKYSQGLKKMVKSYSKLKKILGADEVEFFKTNNDYEEFKKRFPKLKDAIDKTTPKWAKFVVNRFLKVP